MTRTTRASLVAASLLLLPSLLWAAELPGHGMSMDEVRKTFGSPARDMGAVGSPAITRWVYDGFTVYFEGRRVVHTVRTQPLGAADAAPAMTVQEQPAAPLVVRPAPAPEPAPVAVAPAPEPAAAPVAPAPAPTPAPASTTGSGFRFDPATGRLIIDGDEPADAPAPQPAAVTVETAGDDAPKVIAPFEQEGAPAGGDSAQGSALDDTLEFDPETGTFRPKP